MDIWNGVALAVIVLQFVIIVLLVLRSLRKQEIEEVNMSQYEDILTAELDARGVLELYIEARNCAVALQPYYETKTVQNIVIRKSSVGIV